jgi:hypothetical protein
MTRAEKLAARIELLSADELEILETLLSRLEKGRKCYGPWMVNDGRDYDAEALAEVMDALHYCAARLVQLNRCPCCGRKHREKVCA